MRATRKLTPLLLAVALALTPLTALASRLPESSVTQSMRNTDAELGNILRKSTSEQGSAFARLINNNMRYATTRSFLGKEASWLGFVDFFAQYKDGQPTGYVLERASVQYGTQALPAGTESSTLYVGDRHVGTQNASANSFGFSFVNSQPIALPDAAATVTPALSVRVNGRGLNINLKQAYPGSGIPSVQYVLTAMAPAYVDYVRKNGDNGGFDHCLLRLRSYVSDSNTLSRSYTWELTLVHSSNLPCKSTVIRYDCSTEKINISQRELRNYFS